jgi:acetoin utilization transport system permease protein
MFIKALWLKDYKQSKFIIWAFWLVSFYIPYKFYEEINSTEYMFRNWESWGNNDTFQYYFYWMFTEISLLHVLILIVLASVLVGYERTNQGMDFTLSLPFKRRDIMLAKWFIGVVNIIGATTISVLFSYVMVENSILDNYIPDEIFLYYYLTAITVFIGVYTFSLLIGLLSGSVVSQFVFSWIFLFFPYGIWTLVEAFYSYHYRFFTGKHLWYGHYDPLNELFMNLTFPIQLLDIGSGIHEFVDLEKAYSGLPYLMIPVVVTIISLLLMSYLSNWMKSENNGKLLTFEKLAPVLKVGVFVCFYLLGGAFFGGMNFSNQDTSNLFSYHIAGIIVSVIMYFILTKIIGMRIQFGKK